MPLGVALGDPEPVDGADACGGRAGGGVECVQGVCGVAGHVHDVRAGRRRAGCRRVRIAVGVVGDRRAHRGCELALLFVPDVSVNRYELPPKAGGVFSTRMVTGAVLSDSAAGAAASGVPAVARLRVQRVLCARGRRSAGVGDGAGRR